MGNMRDGGDNKQSFKRKSIARILSEALPFMQRYSNKCVVVKYGGHAMVNKELSDQFAADIVQLKLCGINPIVVHGGGPQIGQMLKRLNIESRFVGGLRVTDEKTVEVVEMVLSGTINKGVVSAIQNAGGNAVGLSGKDGNLCIARKLQAASPSDDLGFVGEPDKINPHLLKNLLASNAIPVIAPIGTSDTGQTYNINADTFAGAIAVAMGAKRLLLLTDVRGVLAAGGELINELHVAEVPALISDGTITAGMIPKIESCVSVVEGGVEGVIILDGRVSHCVLLELFTALGVGTRISRR